MISNCENFYVNKKMMTEKLTTKLLTFIILLIAIHIITRVKKSRIIIVKK